MFTRLASNVTSPIRYPGGDYHHAKDKVQLRPLRFKEYRDPCCGGASMLYTVKRHNLAETYWINDKDPDLINFKMILRDDCESLVNDVTALHKKYGLGNEELFDLAEQMVQSEDKTEAAAGYFVRNRIAYGGSNGKGSFNTRYMTDERGLKPVFIDNLWGFSDLLQGVRITNLDYAEVVEEKGSGVFGYLDLPYERTGKSNYPMGKVNFDETAAIIKKSKHQWLVAVNDSEENRDRFADLSQISRPYHSNMGGASTEHELLLANYMTPFYEDFAEEVGEPISMEITKPVKGLKPLKNRKSIVERLFINTDINNRPVEWYTPEWILDILYAANDNQPFDLDPCSPVKGENAPVNAEQHFTIDDDGLKQNWKGRVFMNPPFDDLRPWLEKAADSVWCKDMDNAPTENSAKREKPMCEIVVGLFPARTHTRYWRDYVNDHAKVFFINGKYPFREGKPGNYKLAKQAFPDGLAFVVWGNHKPFTDHLLSLPKEVIDVSDRSHPEIPDKVAAYWEE
jgi:DNA adenine methylase